MDIGQVILVTLVTQAATEYYTSEKPLKWKEAVETCNMAIPDLHPTREDFKVNIDYDHSKGDVRLGYFMKMTVFDYIGCVKLNNQSFIELGQSNSPGLCYSFCRRKDIIGVSDDKCICVDSLDNYGRCEMNCTKSCGSRNEGVACGGNGYMSVYKVNKHVSTSDREKICMFFEQYSPNDKRFRWNRCATYSLRVVCDNELTDEGQSYPWLKSMNTCLKKGLLPKSYQALTAITVSINPFWSGVISSDAIFNYTEWNINLKDLLFGYLSAADKSVYFTERDKAKFVLCNSAPTEQDTTLSYFGTSLTNPAINTAVVTGSTTNRKADSVRGDSTTITVTRNTITLQLPDAKSQGQDVSVIIAVSVGTCVVIIVVVVLLLIRRGKVPNLCEIFTRTCCAGQDATMKDNVDKQSTVIKDSKQNTVNSEQECNSYRNNVQNYFVFELSNSDHSMHDINYERNEPVENGSIYNEIGTEAYTFAHVDKKKTVSLDDDYDTTTAAKLKRNAGQLNGEYAELGNDVYNHIGKSPVSVGTDQTYNIPHSDSYSKIDKEHDEGSAYSHLNSKQFCGSSNNPDNVYHTTNGFKDTNI